MSPIRVETTSLLPDGSIRTVVTQNPDGFSARSSLAKLIAGLPLTTLFRKERRIFGQLPRDTRNNREGRVYSDLDLLRLGMGNHKAKVTPKPDGVFEVKVTKKGITTTTLLKP